MISLCLKLLKLFKRKLFGNPEMWVDHLTFSLSGHGQWCIIHIAGWHHQFHKKHAPTIRIRINHTYPYLLEFNQPRPDVEKEHGKINYLPGFDQNFFVPDQPVSFVIENVTTNKILKSGIFGHEQKAEHIGFKTNPGQSESLPTNFTCEASSYEKPFRMGDKLRNTLTDVAMNFAYRPKISILIPVYNGDPVWLEKAIESIYNQLYPNWEICIADDASTRADTRQFLEKILDHPQIKIEWRKSNGNIAAATNTAASIATGEFFLFMDQDDLLTMNALFEFVRQLNVQPDLELIYGDECKISIHDQLYDFHFKPDYSYFQLLGFNYFTHPTLIRKTLFEKAGGIREGFQSAQDYDLLLRVIDQTHKIAHIRKVLYHWRAIPGSMAYSVNEKPEVLITGEKALHDHLTKHHPLIFTYQPHFAQKLNLPIFQLDGPDKGPVVDIIIFKIQDISKLERCIRSLIEKTTYANFTLTILIDKSAKISLSQFLNYYNGTGTEIISVLTYDGNTPESQMLNDAVKHSSSPYFLLLEADSEITEPRWISRMVTYAGFKNVGIVGARILNSDRKILHAGISLPPGNKGLPIYNHQDSDADCISRFFQAETAGNKIAVSASCMLINHDTFKHLQGFNDLEFSNKYYDIDFCIRAKENGYQTVYCPGAELICHRDSSENDLQLIFDQQITYQGKYMNYLDPYFNSNILNINEKYPVFEPFPGYEMYLNKPLRVIIYTHNLNWEGAPKVAVNLATGLKNNGFDIIVLSPVDGLAREYLSHHGISTLILSTLSENLTEIFKNLSPDLVFVNVLHSYFVVNAAYELHIPSIWMVHESFTRDMLENNIPGLDLKQLEKAFNLTEYIIFCSSATAGLYQSYNTRGRFRTIHNTLDPLSLTTEITTNEKIILRKALGLAIDEFVVINVGTISPHKNQALLVDAAELLKNEKMTFYLVGARSGVPYKDQIEQMVNEKDLEASVKIIEETPDIHIFYQIADLFVFTSINESYPLVILEAMAYGLPIMTTPVFGVNEQVRFGINAIKISPDNQKLLADEIKSLMQQPALLEKMGQNSRKIYENLDSFDEMITKHQQLITSAILL